MRHLRWWIPTLYVVAAFSALVAVSELAIGRIALGAVRGSFAVMCVALAIANQHIRELTRQRDELQNRPQVLTFGPN